jgi:sec-independent protein translocase protein TatA
MFSGGFSLIHWLVLGVIILLLFGKGRFSDMMGDVAKGLKSFKKGLTEDEEAAAAAKRAAEPAKRLADGATIEVPPVDRTRAADPAAPAATSVDPREP